MQASSFAASNGMELPVYNQKGEETGTVVLPDQVFDVPFSNALVSQVLDVQRSNARAVIAHTKDRSEVRGGGKKPWRQKGTGRARHASIRSPIWKGGGVAFGPTKERSFARSIPRKMSRKAVAMVLSSKVRDREFLVLDQFVLGQPKTREALGVFNAISPKFQNYRTTKKKQDSILLITSKKDKSVERAVRNLPFANTISATSLNVKDLLTAKYLVILKNAISVITAAHRIP